MKRNVVGSLAAILSLFLVTSATASAVEKPLPEPRGERIRLRDAASASSFIAGRGIQGIDAQPVVDRAGRELLWKQVRRHVDEEGNVHLFYRQYLAGDITAEVYGSGAAAHYTTEGKLWSVTGRQFRNVNVANDVSLDRESAIDAAAYRLLSRSVRVRRLPELSPETRERSINAAKLMLVERDGAFRYTYFTFASDAKDQPYQIAVDADTEEIVAVIGETRQGNCVPTGSMTQVSATGVAVRAADGVPARAVKAHPATDRNAPYVHEGYWHSVPYKTVFQQVVGNPWGCNPQHSATYTIFPLLTENGVPIYKDQASDPQFKGSAAGDAIYHTDLTLRALKGMGRDGWDDNNGAAKIVVQVTSLPADRAKFNSSQANPTVEAPTNSVMLATKSKLHYASSSLDWVAHEWGHGVIDTSADFDTNTTTGNELHEGFADVIAHMVEKSMQSSGSGLEKSDDWTMHEDAGTSGYARGAIDDGSGHSWSGPGGSMPFMNDLLHANDTPTTSTSTHSHGNKLSVVFKLLSTGGYNPVCSRLSLSGCSTNVSGQTFAKAKKILFRAIESHLDQTSTWSTLADEIADAAFGAYSQCASGPTFNASAEQQAVYDAFTAIGHGGSGYIRPCP